MSLVKVSDELKKWLNEHPEVSYSDFVIHFNKLVDKDASEDSSDN